ncbi:MAG: 1,5-anhydro-D-fructose reductase [Candidatus Thorarchaeota archaeon]|nr:MAG: 1,5-anhydro-D-fructose reductase [Candidatus Thorarchaeota archaeon]
MAIPKIGIIGTGNMGRIHARILDSVHALAGVSDIDISKAKQEASKYNVPHFDNYGQMIEECNLDGVVIATPSSTHAEIAMDVAEQFQEIKGIMIEKPLSSTLDDAKKVAKTIKEHNKVGLVSHTETYNPIVERAIQLIQNGAIGNPTAIIHDRRGFVQPERIPSLGDVFEDIGVHDFDIMTRISSGPAKLYSQCQENKGILNAGAILVKFENGTEHSFHLSRQYAGRKRNMDVSGTKGTLVLDLFGQIIKVQDLDQEPSADSRTISLPERGATIKVYGEPVREALTDFITCLRTGREPKVTLDDGVAALAIVEAARKSARTGEVVDISTEPRTM